MQGAFIIEYAGEVIDERELGRRMEHARMNAEPHFYIMELSAGEWASGGEEAVTLWRRGEAGASKRHEHCCLVGDERNCGAAIAARSAYVLTCLFRIICASARIGSHARSIIAALAMLFRARAKPVHG